MTAAKVIERLPLFLSTECTLEAGSILAENQPTVPGSFQMRRRVGAVVATKNPADCLPRIDSDRFGAELEVENLDRHHLPTR